VNEARPQEGWGEGRSSSGGRGGGWSKSGGGRDRRW